LIYRLISKIAALSKISLFLFFIFLSNFGNAQSTLKEEIFFYGDVMLNAMDDANRVKAGEKFNSLFYEYVEQNPQDSLGWLKWVSIQAPDDNAFRIITWELKKDEDNFAYFGYLQLQNGKGFVLEEEASDYKDVEFESRGKEDWLGAVYYNILKVNETDYILFGKNQLDKFENLKIAEVLSLEEEDPIFGKEIFQKGADTKSRLVLRYADDASVSLNYNTSLGLIIFDHLIARMGRIEGQGSTFLPDGSYEGYVPQDGLWMYKEKLYDHVFEEAPRPNPVLDKKQKNIFGKQN